MKALIITYNRLTLPLKLAGWLASNGIEPVFIDNNSDYPPLLDYYQTRCPFAVVRMDQNYGHKVVWSEGLLGKLGIKGDYIVTDPDLDLSAIPGDWLSVLEEGLRRYPKFTKCGFSLEINDLPPASAAVWEKQFWQYPIDDMYFNAQIDTTFALCRSPEFTIYALRTNRPYIARHIPWYYDHVKDLPEDEQYYYRTQNADTASHTNVRKD